MRIAHADRLLLFTVLAATSFVIARPGVAETSDSDRLVRASEVLLKFTEEEEKAIPAALLERAHGVAVIPSLVRAGFFFGGRRGRGVISVRKTDGEWTNPAFITLTGGNFGLQFGAEWADVVLVFENEQSVKHMQTGKFTFGGDAAAVAGPLGTRATAAITGKAEVYIYTRSRGLYAGAAFEGARLDVDEDGDEVFYGGDDRAALGPVTAATPASAQQFLETLRSVTTAGAPRPKTPTGPGGSAPSNGGSAEEAIIYPLEEGAH
ncbi:MAG TPA: lipid-binding SYLF domain-containing protein [Gammaproteobacteria bacterium]|nr:lipid-binding SYLF domain-containing protein [Gammaproteobacteria bacterium]